MAVFVLTDRIKAKICFSASHSVDIYRADYGMYHFFTHRSKKNQFVYIFALLIIFDILYTDAHCPAIISSLYFYMTFRRLSCTHSKSLALSFHNYKKSVVPLVIHIFPSCSLAFFPFLQ